MPELPQRDFTEGGIVPDGAVYPLTVDLSDRVACVLAGFFVLPLPVSSASVPSVANSASVS